ncbi:DUF349 domain-containing protein [Kitasatospora sp. MAP5-34]|uniref:DUF349 domain-containing protein n=1 Tax=Kitasatospora sp. MAP5-34 TaxID=3035102 RepID=UPI0024750EE4|nr:DUF349 domain-containing protein [Kitasatospora sp. MAP5-34]MDH6575896.1 hypothetical protein [Kitasatospora sp. MAP5-34]
MTSDPWGRVDEQGTVYVRTAEGERAVGSWQAGSPEEALAYFERKFEGLAAEIGLLEHRVRKTDLAAKEALAALEHLRAQVVEAHAVGDLAALAKRLDTLTSEIESKQVERKAAKAKAQDETRVAKEKLVVEAEQLAESTQWREAGDRLRALVDIWKALPRLDRKSDDELWHRFSHARSVFSKHRKAHFATLDAERDEARSEKEKLVAEAEALSSSTEWGDTAARYRDLMTQWKSAGRAQRDAEEELWARFRGAQDVFFQARSAVFSERDAEQGENQKLKEALLIEAEAILPITDLKAAKAALREVSERWEAIGHVPRDARPRLDARLNTVERAIREAEDAEWKRSNPEAKARAAGMTGLLQSAIDKLQADLDKARAAGNASKVAKLETELAGRQALLDQALKSLEEFSG